MKCPNIDTVTYFFFFKILQINCFDLIYSCSCRCYKTYMQLNMKNPEVTNNYTEINHSRSPIRSPESTTKPLYENCTDLSSSIQQESFLYDNCRNLGDVVIIDTRHSYAEVLDGRISQRTENHLYVNT